MHNYRQLEERFAEIHKLDSIGHRSVEYHARLSAIDRSLEINDHHLGIGLNTYGPGIRKG